MRLVSMQRLIFIVAAIVVLQDNGLLAQKVIPPGGFKERSSELSTREKSLEDIRIRIGRVRYGGGGDWYNGPSTLPNLLAEFQKRTGIPTTTTEKVVELTDPDISAYPFIFMTGHGNIKLTTAEQESLREYLLKGGFLFADDDYGMDKAFRRMVAELFPERRLVLVPADHPIYHSFYDLPGPPKIEYHDGLPPQGFGIFEGNRLMIYYTYQSDIGDGLEDPEVHHASPKKREQAMKMAINILYYALTK